MTRPIRKRSEICGGGKVNKLQLEIKTLQRAKETRTPPLAMMG